MHFTNIPLELFVVLAILSFNSSSALALPISTDNPLLSVLYWTRNALSGYQVTSTTDHAVAPLAQSPSWKPRFFRNSLSLAPAMLPPPFSANAVTGTRLPYTAPTPDNSTQTAGHPHKSRFVLYGDQWVGNNTAGTPNPSKLKGFTHYNIAFWVATEGPQDNALAWTQATDKEREAVKKSFHDADIRLMVSAFGATDVPQSGDGLGNATKTANRLADFVVKYGLDGVDVDYEELDLFANGKAVPWLKTLTKQLRERLPSPKYTISHAPLAPWFSRDVYKDGGYSAVNDEVGDLIDFYNVQFYNQGNNAYVDCQGLLWTGPQQYPNSSVFEIHSKGKVDLSKIVIGKPGVASDANNGYMSKRDLGKCASEARDHGWSAGLMWWEYPNFGGDELARVRSYGF